MMARQVQTPALRPFLPADAPVLAEIFQASIEELTGEDYSEAQQAAWASLADDVEEFGARLAENLISVRHDARAAKNWAESDRIRDELLAMGVALKDNKDGTTTWEAAR